MGPSWMRALLLGAACAGAPPGGTTEPTPPPSIAPADAARPQHASLEAIFWECDYVATTRGVDATPAAACAAATRELRQVKFEGSFQRLLEWWRENRAQHGRIRRERNDPEF